MVPLLVVQHIVTSVFGLLFVWNVAGNDLNITPDLFLSLLEKAAIIKEQCETEEIPIQEDSSERERFQAEYENIRRQSEMVPSGMVWNDSDEETSDPEADSAPTTNVGDDTEKGTVDEDATDSPKERWPLKHAQESQSNSFSDDESDNDRESTFTAQAVKASELPRVHTSAADAGEITSNDTPLSPTSELGKEDTVRLIGVDLPRTFPHLAFFHDGGPMAEGLEKVLQAYACYR